MEESARCISSQHVKVAIRIRPVKKTEAIAAKKRSRLRQAAVPNGVSRAVAKRCEQLHSLKAWELATINNSSKKYRGSNDNTSSTSDSSFDTTMDTLIETGAIRKNEGRNVFSFDWIFDEDKNTREVYQDVVYPIIETVFAGTHGTIFTYGQTGSGKTHTMQGRGTSTNDNKYDRIEGTQCRKDDDEGVIQMGVRDLFEKIIFDSNTRDYSVRASYFEIYNEQVRDLLGNLNAKADNEQTMTNKNNNNLAKRNNNKQVKLPILTVRENINGNDVHVDAVQRKVMGLNDVLYLLQHGNENRTRAPTTLNEMSSRSHAIFRLSIESRKRIQHQEDDKRDLSSNVDVKELKECNRTVRVSVLNFVDLAGSESCNASSTVGQRKQEGGKINQSLLSLSQVIYALSLSEKKRPKFINYRNSKLTRLLRPHLTGNAVMVILCCVTIARAHLEETRSTLKFAYNAKKIKMNPIVNDIADDKSLIEDLQKKLTSTRHALKDLKEKEKLINSEKSSNTTSALKQEQQEQQKQKQKQSPRRQQQHQHRHRHQHQHQQQQQQQRQRQRQRQPQPQQQQQQNHHQEKQQEKHDTPPSLETTAVSTTDAVSGYVAEINEMGNSKYIVTEQTERYEALSQEHNQVQPVTAISHPAVPIHKRDELVIENASHKALRPMRHSFVAEKSVDCFSTITDHSPRIYSRVKRHEMLPSEVIIIQPPPPNAELNNMDINDRLNDAEQRAKLLTDKLNAADIEIKQLSRDLTSARICIHDLVFRNASLEKQLNKKHASQAKK